MRTKMKKYRVYINQVNQTYVEVRANDKIEAAAKGYAKWRKEDAHSQVTSVLEIGLPNKAGSGEAKE